MNETHSILQDLEDAIARGTADSRERALWHATDLLIAGRYCEEESATFGEVIGRLADEIETEARAKLAHRLARIEYSPASVVRKLAFDDAIEVAGPVLRESERLDDVALLENARTKSQAHLLAISIRRVLSRAVTDILLRRGNDEVVHSTVSNPGADLSERSVDALLDRAAQDGDLAACLALRPDLPRHLFLKLVAKASAAVRARLETANPKLAQEVSQAVRTAGRRARSATVALTSQTEIAHRLIRSLHADGRLDDQLVAQFTESRKFDEANAAVAAMANVPVAVAESIMVESRAEGVMILAKVAGLSWPTVKSIILMRDELAGTGPTDLVASKATYERLRPSTAQQVLRFHRVQDAATPAQA